MFTRILVGYDGSKGGKLALAHGMALAKAFQAPLTALWVQEPLPRYSDLPGEPEDQVEAGDHYFEARRKEAEALAQAQGLAITCQTRRGHPAKTLVLEAQEGGFDLLVIGHSDHSEMWGRLLGDTADRVCDHAHCSILVAKA